MPAGLPGRVLQVHPTRACNLRCEHCYSSSGPEERGALAASLLSAAIADAHREGYDVLSISGGEPLLYRSLAEIADAARRCGMAVTVTTNAMLLDPRRIDLLRERVDMVAISLDGAPEAHDRMRGRSGAFAAMQRRLPLLREAGVRFGFVFTLTAGNLADLTWAAEFAVREGASLLQIHPLEAAGRAAVGLEAELPDERLALLAWAMAAALGRRHAGRLVVETDLACLDVVGGATCEMLTDGAAEPAPDTPFAELVAPLVIESDGTVVPLQHGFPRSLALGSLLDRPLADLLCAYRRERYRDLRRVCRRTLSELADAPLLPVVNWYQEVAQRAV